MSSDIYPNSGANTDDKDTTKPILTGRVKMTEVLPPELQE